MGSKYARFVGLQRQPMLPLGNMYTHDAMVILSRSYFIIAYVGNYAYIPVIIAYFMS